MNPFVRLIEAIEDACDDYPDAALIALLSIIALGLAFIAELVRT